MAETYALHQAAKYVNKITGLRRKEEVEIRSDAQGLVRSLQKVSYSNVLMSRIKDELRIAYHAGKNIVIRWVPGHKDITGNEYADSLAKRGVDSRAVASIPMMKKDVMRIIREKEKAVEDNSWSDFEFKNIKLFLPDINTINTFLKSAPSAALCQLVSGHAESK